MGALVELRSEFSEKGSIIPSVEGLKNEVISLEERLAEAKKSGDEDKARYLEERIRRVEIEIDNKKVLGQ